MERSTVTLITLMGVLIFSISGIVVEMRVRPGDDVTIYCDCTRQSGFKIAWLRKSTREAQPPLVYFTDNITLPRYSLVWNSSSITHDLLVKNITESDLGLYYCALYPKMVSKDKSGGKRPEVHNYGNRTTFLSLLDTTLHCANLSQTTSTPPVSDCSVCWKLLVSVCPACVFLSSLVSSTCVYCICRNRTKADPKGDQQGNIKVGKRNEVRDDDVCYASLDIPSSRQKWLKKRTADSSDLCTYSEVKFEKV